MQKIKIFIKEDISQMVVILQFALNLIIVKKVLVFVMINMQIILLLVTMEYSAHIKEKDK
jgi:hypothetical protein